MPLADTSNERSSWTSSRSSTFEEPSGKSSSIFDGRRKPTKFSALPLWMMKNIRSIFSLNVTVNVGSLSVPRHSLSGFLSHRFVAG